ncbi:uncharacterized protein BDW70DRAFT_154716 [Aspergillus foveolatus]|uniref:uncharacterized protein n=1 Tax=Aspergillus foveolatus TaxID=210207 RepID=UPI003CCD74DC
MASDSFLSLKVSDLEILSYKNAETWFTKMQAVLDGKEIWYPVQDVYLICQGLDPLPDINKNNNFFLPLQALLSPGPRRTIPTLSLEPLIKTSATTKVEKI